MNRLQTALKDREKLIGSIASVLAIIMFVSLLEIFASNLRGQSNIIIQPLATALNGLVWSLYAYGRQDWFLLVPNMLACVLGAATALAVLG